MTRNLDARLNTYAPTVLSVFRVVVGLLFVCHGMSHLFGWPVGPSIPVGTWPRWYAGIIEFPAGILITLGLFTRPVAFIASGEMAFAYFTQHASGGFFPIANRGELAVLYCFIFLLLVFIGPGAYALDSRMGRGRGLAGGRGGVLPGGRPRGRWRR